MNQDVPHLEVEHVAGPETEWLEGVLILEGLPPWLQPQLLPIHISVLNTVKIILMIVIKMIKDNNSFNKHFYPNKHIIYIYTVKLIIQYPQEMQNQRRKESHGGRTFSNLILPLTSCLQLPSWDLQQYWSPTKRTCT